MEKTEPEGAFWTFSLSLYGKKGVPSVCVDLQDKHGVDVNVLLYLTFRAADGSSFAQSDIVRLDGQIETWRLAVVRPLRLLRRGLKTDEISQGARGSEVLRENVKSAELLAEKIEQEMLERSGAELGSAERDRRKALGESLTIYMTSLGVRDMPEDLRRYVTLVCTHEYAFLQE